MSIFYLKFRDTRPILEVALKDPDGSAHDLSGASSYSLHVYMSDGTKLSRDMVVYGSPTDGILRYTWLASDWDTSNIDGFLIVGPTLPLRPTEWEHKMEYEVVGPTTARLTWPQDGYDTLRITQDIE